MSFLESFSPPSFDQQIAQPFSVQVEPGVSLDRWIEEVDLQEQREAEELLKTAADILQKTQELFDLSQKRRKIAPNRFKKIESWESSTSDTESIPDVLKDQGNLSRKRKRGPKKPSSEELSDFWKNFDAEQGHTAVDPNWLAELTNTPQPSPPSALEAQSQMNVVGSVPINTPIPSPHRALGSEEAPSAFSCETLEQLHNQSGTPTQTPMNESSHRDVIAQKNFEQLIRGQTKVKDEYNPKNSIMVPDTAAIRKRWKEFQEVKKRLGSCDPNNADELIQLSEKMKTAYRTGGLRLCSENRYLFCDFLDKATSCMNAGEVSRENKHSLFHNTIDLLKMKFTSTDKFVYHRTGKNDLSVCESFARSLGIEMREPLL